MPNITSYSSYTNLSPQVEDFCGSMLPYDIYSIVPNAGGDFVIEYVSDYEATIRLYSPSFNPLASIVNIIASHTSSSSRTRYLVNVTLPASKQYYLIIFSTYYYYAYSMGYRITFRGSSQFTMTKTTGECLFSKLRLLKLSFS